MPGPVAKRSDQRRRKNKPSGPELVTAEAAPVFTPPPADESWHPLMRDWYDSLFTSGQAVFYEPSDVETARLAASIMSQEIEGGSVRAAVWKEFNATAIRLMTTEGDRRRLRVELQRGPKGVADEEADEVMDNYRELFGPSSS